MFKRSLFGRASTFEATELLGRFPGIALDLLVFVLPGIAGIEHGIAELGIAELGIAELGVAELGSAGDPERGSSARFT